MFSIADNLQNVRQRIKKSVQRAGRNTDSVSLLAVTKTKDADVLNEAIEAGLYRFGESYVNEALTKQDALAKLCSPAQLQSVEWHFIGPVQSNKTRLIAQHFDWVQSIDRRKIADRLNDQRPTEMAPVNVCIQVNISHERTKSGLGLDEVEAMAEYINTLSQLKLRGLMAIPMASKDTDPSLEQLRMSFKAMRQAFETLQCRYPDVDTLSMGMSSDIESAIACGSTMVRVGRALFGKR